MRTDFVVFAKTYESKAYSKHAGMAEKGYGVVGVADFSLCISRYAVCHIIGQRYCTEHIAFVDCHVIDEVVKRIWWPMRSGFERNLWRGFCRWAGWG